MAQTQHETRQERSETIELPSLGGLAPDHRRELAAHMRPCAYAAGEVLFHAGTEAERAMVVITEGVVELRRGDNGSARTVATLHPGSVLGETSLLLPGP
ncbi:MAG: cyclic nucleotide-binding domain-containing protein, partial [Planctomycetota bacterium]